MLISRSSCSFGVLSLLLLTLCLSSTVQAQRSRQKPNVSQREVSPREVIQKVSKSLVSIITQDKEGEPLAQASGFFSKTGLSQRISMCLSARHKATLKSSILDLHIR